MFLEMEVNVVINNDKDIEVYQDFYEREQQK